MALGTWFWEFAGRDDTAFRYRIQRSRFEKYKKRACFPFGKQAQLFWQRPTLARPFVKLPSALQRFTSVFGMGTGGSTVLWSPETAQTILRRFRRPWRHGIYQFKELSGTGMVR